MLAHEGVRSTSWLTCNLWPRSLNALGWHLLHSAIPLLLLAQLLHQYLRINLPRDTDTVSSTSSEYEPLIVKRLVIYWQAHSEHGLLQCTRARSFLDRSVRNGTALAEALELGSHRLQGM